MKVTELDHQSHPAGIGTQVVIKFQNGYGASVVSGPLFYSNSRTPWEIAVLNPDGSIAYDTSVTNDVCGYLTDEEANKILAQIEALPLKE